MPVLEREEYIEQAYFFHSFRVRLVDGLPAQEILARISEELLSTTKLPLAISFLDAEIKGSGLMAPAMARIGHYFSAFQTHVISQAEIAMSRFSMEQALLILEREAKYKSENPSLAGLFIFQFESLSRNRLGYTRGLAAMSADPFYTEDWRDYILMLQTRLGDVDFADLIFVRSSYFVKERRKTNPEFEPKYPTLFGEREGKIARANRGRDPMYLFSALHAPAWLSRGPATPPPRRARSPRRPARAEDRPAREPHQARRERAQSGRRFVSGHCQARRHRRRAIGVGEKGRGIVASSQRVGCVESSTTHRNGWPLADGHSEETRFDRVVVDKNFLALASWCAMTGGMRKIGWGCFPVDSALG